MTRIHPALLGGLFIGVLSSLPVVNAANACCCMWVVVGGLLTVYLQQQAKPTAVESGEAALSGLMAGAIGAVIYIVALMAILSGADVSAAIDERLRAVLQDNPQIPAETRALFEGAFGGRNLVVLIAVVTVPMYAVFSMLGALLGVAMFKKKTPAPSSASD